MIVQVQELKASKLFLEDLVPFLHNLFCLDNCYQKKPLFVSTVLDFRILKYYTL